MVDTSTGAVATGNNSQQLSATSGGAGGAGGDSGAPQTGSPQINSSLQQLKSDPQVKRTLAADNAFEILQARLKQSVKACEEFASFIRRKHNYESGYARDTKKAAAASKSSIQSNCVRSKGSFVESLSNVIAYDERLINDVRTPYIKALETMFNELASLAQNFNRLRKQMKEEGNRREKEVSEACAQAEKAKSKYQNLCHELEKCRNSDQTQKKMTLGGRKTGSQQEEELTRKLQTVDQDYQKKANYSQRVKSELVDTYQPKIVSRMQDLILELDNALQLQLAKYAVYNESLIVGMGNQVTPLGKNHVGMRSVASSVDCEQCLLDYLRNSKIETKSSLVPVQYKRHSVFAMAPDGSFGASTQRSVSDNNISAPTAFTGPNTANSSRIPSAATTLGGVSTITPGAASLSSSAYPPPAYHTADPRAVSVSSNASGPADQQPQPQQQPQQQPSQQQGKSVGNGFTGPRPLAASTSSVALSDAAMIPSIEETAPGGLFGQPIDEVSHDDEMVPLFVKKCIELLETYGKNTEGIYRLSPNKNKLDELRNVIDRDPDNLSVLDPPTPLTDDWVHVIASLHKKFFAMLPDPLLTFEQSINFMKAGQIEDVKTMHLQLHRIVFELPDANYFTLRDLLFHFARINEIPKVRMNDKALAIVWSNNLFAANSATSTDDLQIQQRVIEELIKAAPDIFNPVDD